MVHSDLISTAAGLVLLGGFVWTAFWVKRWLRGKVCHV